MALFSAIPNIVNVLLITSLFFVVFGIIGVNFLKGLFYYCNISEASSLLGYDDDLLDDRWDCLNFGGVW